MLRLSRLTDYAIVLMTYAARLTAGRWATARALAKTSQLPLATVMKLLKQLQVAELLESHRGIAGGYRLKRASADISVGDIIEAIEGPINITDCCDKTVGGVAGEDAAPICEIESGCPVKENWQKINAVVRQALLGLSLEDMAVPIQCNLLTGLSVPGRGDALVQIAINAIRS